MWFSRMWLSFSRLYYVFQASLVGFGVSYKNEPLILFLKNEILCNSHHYQNKLMQKGVPSIHDNWWINDEVLVIIYR